MTVRQSLDRVMMDGGTADNLSDAGLAGFARDPLCAFEVHVDSDGAEVTCWLRNNGDAGEAWLSWTKDRDGLWVCDHDFQDSGWPALPNCSGSAGG